MGIFKPPDFAEPFINASSAQQKMRELNCDELLINKGDSTEQHEQCIRLNNFQKTAFDKGIKGIEEKKNGGKKYSSTRRRKKRSSTRRRRKKRTHKRGNNKRKVSNKK